MADQKNRWSWDVAGFEPWKSSPPPPPPSSSSSPSVEQDDRKPNVPLVRRYSISATSVLPQPKPSTVSKLERLRTNVKVLRCFISNCNCSVASSSFSTHSSSQFGYSFSGFFLRCQCLDGDILGLVFAVACCILRCVMLWQFQRGN